MKPSEFIEILKAANGEELAEIRRLLGLSWLQFLPSSPCPAYPIPAQPCDPQEPWFKVTCVGGFRV